MPNVPAQCPWSTWPLAMGQWPSDDNRGIGLSAIWQILTNEEREIVIEMYTCTQKSVCVCGGGGGS